METTTPTPNTASRTGTNVTARPDGTDVVIRIDASDAECIVHAMKLQARGGFRIYRDIADVIEDAISQVEWDG